jgi:membrane protein required for colicin V production
MAGALLGAVRVGLLAVLIVVIFDRIIPAGREPAFLKGSQLRPILSQAGRAGLKSLPPDIEDYIDRLKRQRGL